MLSRTVRLGVLCSRIRLEEKLIFRALEERGVEYDRLDERRLALQLQANGLVEKYDLIWCRSISHSRALYALGILNGWGIKTVNSYQVVQTCGDKVLTTTALIQHGVPTPRTVVALSVEAALQAIEEMGYPVVLKPAMGSWGRLLSKVNDRETAEAVLRHKATLGGPLHSVFYIQEYVDKPSRDIRTLVIGEEVVYAMYRRSAHWITNTARGGEALLCPLSPEIRDLSLTAAQAVGGGILAVDLMETDDGRLVVGEVNHTPEFHGAMQAVDVDIAGKMVDYMLQQA
ncbi:MAG TPA: lysine biosynthesis protein LysX [Anaerolineae bacterium]|nr:lysine biosynthesis protein LysX [Anaerolineae bacterium]